MLRRHKLGMRGSLVKACRRTVYKQRLPVGLDKLSRRPATLRSSRYDSPVQDVHAGREAELAASARSSRPCPRPGPAASVDGGAGILECFGRGNETSSAGSIDDPSSILQSPCLRPGHSSRYRTTRRPRVICAAADPRTAARQNHAQLHGGSAHGRSATKAPASPHLVPVRSAPAHPGSSRSWRGPRRRVAVPRLSRDGVPPCLCRNTAAARRTSPAGRPGAVRAGGDRPSRMTAVSGNSVLPGFRPAPSVCRV